MKHQITRKKHNCEERTDGTLAHTKKVNKPQESRNMQKSNQNTKAKEHEKHETTAVV
jgi:hypothetical protein